jgi:hypothetical protein
MIDRIRALFETDLFQYMYQKSILTSAFIKTRITIDIPIEYFQEFKPLKDNIISFYFTEFLSKRFPLFRFIPILKKDHISIWICHSQIEQPIAFKIIEDLGEYLRCVKTFSETQLRFLNDKLNTNPTFIEKFNLSTISLFLLIVFNY